MKKYAIALSVVIGFITLITYSCSKPQPLSPGEQDQYLSAGSQTVNNSSSSAFSECFPVLSADKQKLHNIGDIAFEATYVAAPAALNPGLGPIYNNNNCVACHSNEGEGNPPLPGGQLLSMLFRISIPGTDAHGGPNPVPGFGGQLQDKATPGVQPEGTVNISYTDVNLAFEDGTPYQLQIPQYVVTNTYIPFPGNAMISPRVAPRLVGLGLLEAVPESEVLQNANNNLPAGDTSAINGKPNYVWDYSTSQNELGRFGWKAEEPTVLQQTAGAFNQDMGITNYVFSVESSYGQSQYEDIKGDPSPEIADSLLFDVAFYVQTLAVPARRNVDVPQVERGQQIFNSSQAQCASCHTPTMTTGTNVAFPELSNITIHAYTDLLLHDMGAGLADNRPANLATGRQFRTTPLWGIGLTRLVNPGGCFLHDGRARTILEAIMWHGGEAYNAKEYVKNLSASDRAALLAFVGSL